MPPTWSLGRYHQNFIITTTGSTLVDIRLQENNIPGCTRSQT